VVALNFLFCRQRSPSFFADPLDVVKTHPNAMIQKVGLEPFRVSRVRW
jgi:hypothetical protein